MKFSRCSRLDLIEHKNGQKYCVMEADKSGVLVFNINNGMQMLIEPEESFNFSHIKSLLFSPVSSSLPTSDQTTTPMPETKPPANQVDDEKSLDEYIKECDIGFERMVEYGQVPQQEIALLAQIINFNTAISLRVLKELAKQ